MNKFLNSKVLQITVATIIAVAITFVIINFLPFAGILDEFKISFKTSTMENIVKYYSLTLAVIILPIYIALYLGIVNVINLICKKIKKED